MKKVMVIMFFLLSVLAVFAGVKEAKVTEVNLPKFGVYSSETVETYQSVNKYQESQSKMEGRGFWGSLVARFFPTGKSGTILNLEEKMMYELDFEKKTYRKSPIEKFFEETEHDYSEDDTEEDYDEAEEYDSRYRIIRQELNVSEGRRKQKINQFDAREYTIVYLLEKEEIETKKRLTDSLFVSVFTSDDATIFAKANEIKLAHSKAMMEAIGWEMEEEQYNQLLGLNWISMLSMMDDDVAPADREIDYQQLETIKGTPVFVEGSYYLKEFDPALSAAAEKPKEKKKTGGFGLGRFMDKVVESVQDSGDDKKAEMNNQYQLMLTYKTETKEISFDSIRKDLFLPPEDFKEIK